MTTMKTTYPDLDSRSAAFYERARKVMPGGNTRTSLWWPPYPLYAVSGKGAYVTDVEGDTRLDLHNAFSTLIHGHSHPDIVERVQKQAAMLTCVGMSTELEIELAEALISRIPGAEHIRFSNSGTEATMTALKAARGLTGRARYAKCEGCYHGSYEALELSTSSRPENWGPAEKPNAVEQSRGTPQSMKDEALILPFNDIDAARALLAEHGHAMAAVFVDPVPVRMGLIEADPNYLAMLREETSARGIVLVFDEVVTYRFGRGGYQEIVGITPDLTTLGKLIGGGLPIGAIAGTKAAMSAFDPSGDGPIVWHGGTFNGNPLTMTAGIASVEALTQASYAHMHNLADRARAGLNRQIADRGLNWQVTGTGSMLRLHAHDRAIRNYREFYPRAEETVLLKKAMNALLNRGILVTNIGVISISSVMTHDDIDMFLDQMAAVFDGLADNP
tara:strand:+ start:33332 stop:34669 length:1338 start_codon:yes stop_codon:yes gene_type:complete